MNLENDLYKEIILDHYKSKRNRYIMEDADYREEGVNPSCGDDIELFLRIEGDMVTDVSYQGVGCSICLASANMLCDALTGRNVEEAQSLLRMVKSFFTADQVPDLPDYAGDLVALEGVRSYPVRIKCALLSWSTLEQILSQMESGSS